MKQSTTHRDSTPLPQHRWGSLVSTLLAPVVIVLVVAAVFRHTQSFALLNFDDPLHLTANPFIQPDSPDRFARFWREPYAKLYVPITYNVWAIVYAGCFDPQTGMFSPVNLHRLNVVTHAVNAGLVLLLLSRLLTLANASNALSITTWHKTLATGCGALLFALHPLQAESVAWIAEFRGLLATLFALLAWCVHVHAMGRRPVTSITLEVVATLLFAASLLCKPSTATLPFMVACVDVILLRRPIPVVAARLGAWLFLAIGCLLAMKLAFQPDNLSGQSLLARPFVAIDSITFYLGKLVWPFALCADYSRTPSTMMNGTAVYWTWIIPAWIAALLWWKPNRLALACVAVFVFALLPVLGLVPFEFQFISTVADRYAYLALTAFGILVSMMLARQPRWIGAGVAVVALLAWRCVDQTRHWRDDQSLWTHAATVNPRAIVARANLAVAAAERGDIDAARALFGRIIQLDPKRANGYVGIGSLLLNTGNATEALTWFDRAAKAQPRLAEPHVFAGNALLALGRAAEAENRYRQAIELEPDAIEAMQQLAALQFAGGRLDDAEALVDRMLELNPRDVKGWMLRADLCAKRDDTRGYIDAMNTAVRYAGADPTPLDALGRFAVRIQDWNAAIECFERSLKFSPDRAPILVELGTALARSGQFDQAIDTLERARLLAPDSAVIENNLRSARTLKEQQRAAPGSAPASDQKQ